MKIKLNRNNNKEPDKWVLRGRDVTDDFWTQRLGDKERINKASITSKDKYFEEQTHTIQKELSV